MSGLQAEAIRLRGLVQGVGLRPTVWRLAARYRLRGWVANEGDGVRILACGERSALQAFAGALLREAPPLARIDALERTPAPPPAGAGFRILDSRAGAVHGGVVPDAATCGACLRELRDPASRRHRYPFTNCTHCGPRLSIVERVPYDRAATTMRGFAMCAACRAEYEDPADRRFHAQPIACPACGPRAWLARADGTVLEPAALGARDAVAAAARLLAQGHIVAVKGLGGFQLACDAQDGAAVARLRQGKRREAKPFALMARDLAMVRRYAVVDAQEAALLQSATAPIVLLARRGAALATQVAPGLQRLGFMLPNTPLHHLLLEALPAPIVLTSGNASDEPQCIEADDARARLGGIASHFLLHDRPIARRLDDAVVHVAAGAPRLLRRGRGDAPAPLPLHPAFADAPPVLATGGALKNSFCLLRGGQAVLSHHIGDLDEPRTREDGRRALDDYLALLRLAPERIAVDLHPDDPARALGLALARARGCGIEEVQHHHAHIAACLAEHGIPPDAPPVLGIALDGLGWGTDGHPWGGEFLLASLRDSRRLACLRPVPMPGGARAAREPWRNTWAQLRQAFGAEGVLRAVEGLPLHDFLARQPLATLESMVAHGTASPLASSCGRLFDAVAAAAGLCRARTLYEGQAAMELEAAAACEGDGEVEGYSLGLRDAPDGLPWLDPAPLWPALLDDLRAGLPPGRIALRFHEGLAQGLARLADRLADTPGLADRTVALGGGVFHNRLLLQRVSALLSGRGWRVLAPAQVPAGDGGLALGQAAVAAARACPA